ncbi:MAG: hypothetical protein K9L69_02465 [Candidatus Omnitrophica bacterium]|nr:hypothetical protein [Candidatus Omnitrophota bacterium]MCF7887644.1 hypothetical protein [Candidatus Omnitrophota bacterium]MCF7894983.1 hypothetical protein [Candidatus Omnitrophota bacterium]
MKGSKLFFIISLILIFSVFFSQYSIGIKGFSFLRAEKEGEEKISEENCFRENIDNFYIVDKNVHLKFNFSYLSRYAAELNSVFKLNRLATFLDILFNHSPPKILT